jgi:hypothetical protein
MTAEDNRDDFATWARTWQDDTRAPASDAQIRDYVTRRGGTVRMFMTVDAIIGAVALPVLGYLWWVADNDVERLSMIGLASITVAAVAFGWWNWSAVVRAAAVTTADFIVVSSERLRRMRLVSRAGWAVLAAELVVFCIWTRHRLYGAGVPVDPAAERFAWLWLGGFTIVAAISLLWFGSWLTRDAERFDKLRRELESERPD